MLHHSCHRQAPPPYSTVGFTYSLCFIVTITITARPRFITIITTMLLAPSSYIHCIRHRQKVKFTIINVTAIKHAPSRDAPSSLTPFRSKPLSATSTIIFAHELPSQLQGCDKRSAAYNAATVSLGFRA
jgi:hypothetical protein